jgi:hypothetical protein
VRRHVEDRHPVCPDDDAVLSAVLAVEDDPIAVDAPNREVVLLRRNDDAPRVGPGVEEDCVPRTRE